VQRSQVPPEAITAGDVLRRYRREARLTQAGVAGTIGVSESAERSYELGDNMPADVADRAAHALGAPEITFALCDQCSANWLFAFLPGVDTHPAAQVLNVAEETREAGEAMARLDVRNPAAQDGPARQAVERTIDHLFDLVPAAAIAIASLCRTYGLDMRALHRRHRAKLQARGYTRTRSEEADVA